MHKTGATRYQKFLKAEKAKTKLKGKKDKELPKGTNVTKTNFKVKKIVIKDQLKKHDHTEALTVRKLNTQELLSRLNHFNTNARVEALNGINEIITSHPVVLLDNLGSLISGICALILNIEKVVRQAALKVLHLILSNGSQEKIEPFFDILSTYLRNAMTHIDSRIQEDSLQLLDILILCTPSKIAEDFQKIIPSFLDMISKLRIDQPGRVLTVNLNTQITSIKWRTKVFQRLRNLMQQYANHNKIFEPTTRSSKNVYKYDNSKNFNNYPLFEKSYISNCHVSCFSSKASVAAIEVDEIQKFNEFTDVLLPMLFETWLEVCPNNKTNTTLEMVVSEDSAVLLKNMLEIFSLVHAFYKYFNDKNSGLNIENTFLQKYRLLFSQHIISFFPYVTVVKSRQINPKDDKNNVEIDAKMVLENLEICHLFIKFNPNVNKKLQGKEISDILSYIEKTFTQSIVDTTDDKVISILYSLFSNESTGWCKTLIVLDSLLRKIIWVYFNSNISNSFKQKIFALLCKIALNEKLTHFHSSDAFEMWLKHLPDILLCESIHSDTISIIHRFAVTNNKVFNAVLKPKLVEIIKNLPNITVTDSLTDNYHHKLFSLFYWIKVWDNDSLNLLEKQLIDNVYKSDNSKFIFDTLRLRSGATL